MKYRLLSFRAMAVLAVVCAGLAACNSEPKRQLRMNLAPGSSYELGIRSDAEFVLTSPDGKEFKSNNSSEMRLLLRIASVYENGDVLASAMIMNVVPPIFWRQYGSIVAGAEFSARISPLGEVLDLVGTNEMRDGIRSELTNPPASDSIEMPRTPEEHVMAAMSDDHLRSPIEAALRVWPSVPVSPGDTWETGPVYEPDADTYLSRKFTLKSWDPQTVTVSFVAEIAPAERKAGHRFSGTGEGEVRFSPVDGLLKTSRSSRSFSGTFDSEKPSGNQISGTGSTQVDFVPR